MKSLLSFYKERLHLTQSQFIFIDHEDGMVSTVFKVVQPNGEEFILKICSRTGDYLREVYFLKHFADRIPTPRIVQLAPPEGDLHGAILMTCLSGRLLQIEDLSDKRMHDFGSLLARIHLDSVEGFGDLTEPDRLSQDHRIPFTKKFEEGMEECRNHLPSLLMEKCRRYYDQHVDLLLETDGPCVVHRDFRPGNLMIDNGNFQGIIDWSSARGGFAEEDFCPLEFGEWSDNPTYKGAFLAGYASIRKVPEYKRVMPLIRLSRAIGAIGFTVKRGIWENKGAKIYRLSLQYLESLLGREVNSL